MLLSSSIVEWYPERILRVLPHEMSFSDFAERNERCNCDAFV